MKKRASDQRGKQQKCWRFRRLPSSPKSRSGSAPFLPRPASAPDAIRDAAREPDFLAGVLEHMLGDESLLIAFADSAGIDPAEHRAGAERARRQAGNAICRKGLP